MDAPLRQLRSLIESTRVGQALLAGRDVFNVTDSARTDTAGVLDGERNVYRSGDDLVLQVFNESAGAWKEVTLS